MLLFCLDIWGFYESVDLYINKIGGGKMDDPSIAADENQAPGKFH